jgi:hypothetical protein
LQTTSGKSMNSQPGTLKAFIDAAADAVARALAGLQREAKRDAELRDAEVRAVIAELRSEISAVAVIKEQLAARLATLKDGMPGEKGEIGEQGPRGEKGEVGEKGETGARGEPGSAGEKGDRGEQGLPGEKGDPGRDGKDGHTIVPRGTWSESESYGALDIVALNGGSFIALQDDPGLCPGDGWQLLTSPGKRGREGERGPRGEKGEKGERGEPGPKVVAITHSDEGVLTLTNSDGSTAVDDLYPLLSKLG